MSTRVRGQGIRTYKELKEHYEIEKELANRLRHATRQERGQLYCSVYDELYERVPSHPQLTRKMDEATTVKVVSRRMRLLRSYLRPELRFLELGPGDCRLSFEVAKSVRRVYAIDVSAEITRHLAYPKNFDLIISNGCNVPVPEASIDVAYSNQLMEHLHPDDAIEQLRNVYRALVPGGVYICITPNRLSGPHDISKYFDEVATGLHLKEYTLGELDEFLHKVGFRKTQAYISGKGIYIRCSCSFIRLCERAVGALPPSLRKWIAASMILRPLLTTLTVVGIK